MSQSIWAAMTKYHMLSVLPKNRNLFLKALEAGKLKMKELEDLVSGASLLCALWPILMVSLHERKGEGALWGP